MDLNEPLIWVVAISCFVLIGRLVQSGFGQSKGWLVISVLILILLGATYLLRPAIAGYVGIVAWALAILLPMLGMQRVRALLARNRHLEAANVASWIRLLHPLDGWWHISKLLRAMHAAEQGGQAQASALFEPLRKYSGSTGRSATHGLLGVQRRGPEMIHWIETEVGDATLRREPALIASYLRALGETGRLVKLLAVFERFRRSLNAPMHAQNRNFARLSLFAFFGQVRPVQSLFDGPLISVPLDVKQFWLATAEIAAGKPAAAEARFEKILPSGSAGIREAIEYRRSHPLADPQEALDDMAKYLFTSTDLEREHEERYQHAAHPLRRRPIVTWSLVATNLAVFLLEVLSKGGSTDWITLYRLGAATPYEIFHSGQWWRIVTGNFLHFGPAHLIVNMLGLVILGPFIEHVLGHIIYALIYLFSGCAGMMFVMYVAWRRQEPTLLVGASAGIMGLVGPTAAILLIGWFRDRAH